MEYFITFFCYFILFRKTIFSDRSDLGCKTYQPAKIRLYLINICREVALCLVWIQMHCKNKLI